MLGFVLAIAGAATGGNLVADDYHQSSGGSAHKALGILTIVAAAVQVGAMHGFNNCCFLSENLMSHLSICMQAI